MHEQWFRIWIAQVGLKTLKYFDPWAFQPNTMLKLWFSVLWNIFHLNCFLVHISTVIFPYEWSFKEQHQFIFKIRLKSLETNIHSLHISLLRSLVFCQGNILINLSLRFSLSCESWNWLSITQSSQFNGIRVLDLQQTCLWKN